jgi:glycosyltransferase involved in cell wall biosynthesis
LATKAGDNNFYIKDGENGFLADINVQSIIKALNRAKESNLTKIADNGYKQVQNYSWEKITQKTIKIYQEVLNEKSKS